MSPFVEQIHKIVMLIFEIFLNTKTKKDVLWILPILVKISKKKPGFDHIQYSKMTFGYIWKPFVEENDSK